ncbi:uncharacterized protein PHALS_10161 [Plasmopara halstedii]|uniref:Uncharacterized protein n=1 Tax=Plasmopara halstedii TaxID=4781 RepID=A0A0P1AH02_PLAHL|nr:uncharacterized protein PHALS_10161 [Plasmopara halstedii]CEG39935.1 hypothetical protein PHALS_10161 [Plasmopara halstedii]|eukprot:XP_024576304.1 hypothetical protein PHALS_10161 [Plasmopara halstedii]
MAALRSTSANALLNLSPVAIKICDFGFARLSSSIWCKRNTSPIGDIESYEFRSRFLDHITLLRLASGRLLCMQKCSIPSA